MVVLCIFDPLSHWERGNPLGAVDVDKPLFEGLD